MLFLVALLDRARSAARLRRWTEALDLYNRAGVAALDHDDLAAMADAAWWLCRLDQSMLLRRRAYDAFATAGLGRRAAYAAWFLSQDYWMKGEEAAATGWLKRAERHLAADPECVERGLLAITDSDVARSSGDLERARAAAELAIQLGETCGSLDLHAMGIQTLGRALIAAGSVREGVALLDEAMALVIGGRLDPLFTGWIYCNVLITCMECADIARAGEWTESAMAWCDSVPDLSPFHGICRIHVAEVTALRGEWERAQAEALRTAREMEGMEQHVVAEAHYAVGEIALRRGDLPAAEEWFSRAQATGRDPQPGLALVRLAQGKIDAAAAGLRTSLASAAGPPLRRARLLAAIVDVALAAGDIGGARRALADLEDVALRIGTTLLEAMAETARAAIRIAEGRAEDAIQDACRAWSLWQRLKLPYDAARARVLVGSASRLAGDAERAQAELEAARAVFERLGALLDARAAAEQLHRPTGLPRDLSARELQVLRLVAAGRTNREIAAELIISEHTVSRHLQNMFRKLNVSSRASATAFAFAHDLV
jgi:ATP/maltotriose-dependent transcriptional regulator MalT